MSYSGIDTQNNARFFIDAGVQDNPRTGLSTQLKLYEINIDNRGGRARHSALGDAKGTALVYQAQLTILSGFWQIMTRGSR